MLTCSHLHAADGVLKLLGQYQYFTLTLSAKYCYSSSSNVPDRHVRWRWVQCEVKARGDTLTYYRCKNDAKATDKGNTSAALMPIWGRLERDVWGWHEHKVAVIGAGGIDHLPHWWWCPLLTAWLPWCASVSVTCNEADKDIIKHQLVAATPSYCPWATLISVATAWVRLC